MWWLSCLKPSTRHDSPEDIVEAQELATALANSLEETSRPRQQEEEERRRIVENDEAIARAVQEEEESQEKERQLNKSELDVDDEQLTNGQINHAKDEVKEDEQLPKTDLAVIPPYRICDGCNSVIEDGRFVNVLGAVWHPECFCCLYCKDAIEELEDDGHVSNSRGNYHKVCYPRYCYVCGEKFAKKALYDVHPFWKEPYCHGHETDGTAKCCSCERLEPKGESYVMFDDERRLCVECMECAVMSTDECLCLHIEMREFYEGLNMKIDKEFSVVLVEKQALNKAEKEEKKQGNHHAVVTRGLCLSEGLQVPSVLNRPWKGANNRLIGLTTESLKLVRVNECEVTAILILYGFPRVLTGSILAHEMMHAWLKLNGYRNLRKDVEEGLCQVLGHMWLESQTFSSTDVVVATGTSSAAASSSSETPNGSASKKGDQSDFERKLVEFCKDQIETDKTKDYGDGFRKVEYLVRHSSLHETLKEIKHRGSNNFSDSRF